MKTPLRKYLALFASTLLIALVLTACANIGRPEGGPRDEKPPVFVRSNPTPGQVKFNGKRIDVYFNENIQLEDAFNRVVVSPVQKNNPQVSSGGKHVKVELRDTLMPNTTYTIDFANSIKDLNEGNILDGFAIDFSTGDTIDSLRISGMVLYAENLEPAQGLIVGAYTNLHDSALTTLPLERISRTDQYGRFTIRGLKEIPYRIFAINDVNRDYKWDRSEDVAFYDTIVVPSVRQIEVSDTLYAADKTDSISTRPGVQYLPNDLFLSVFNENYSPLYLKDYSRPDRRRIIINFAAKSDSLPTLTIAKGKKEGATDKEWALLQHTPSLDSLEYWIKDPDVIANDSLLIALRYLKVDSLEHNSWTTDTLKFFFRERPDKSKPKKASKEENDSIPKIEYLSHSFLTSSTHEIYNPVIFKSEQPIDSIDENGYRLEFENDSIWTLIPEARFEVDSLSPLLVRNMKIDWKPDTKYRLTIDSAAVWDIYGMWNNTIKHEFKVKQLEDYSNLKFTVLPANIGNIVVELLSSGDKPVRTQAADSTGIVNLRHLAPGDYYARLFIDSNGNGKWDTGSLSDSIPTQPEEVYYYPKKLSLKKNWDVDQIWNIFELPVDMQKPYAILKNKPKLKQGERDSRDTSGMEEDEDDDSPWGNSFNSGGRSSGNRGSGGGLRPNSGGLKRDNSAGMLRH